MPAIERHPLEPFIPQGARVLFLGSFPPPRQRWSMDFFYPNFINDFWRIVGQVFFGDREHFVVRGEKRFDRERIVDFCQKKGIALFDTATEVRRLQDNASDKFLEVVEATDVTALMARLPHLKAIVTTGEKATATLCASLQIADIPKVNSFTPIPYSTNADDDSIVLYRLPSSSRAYPLSFDKKAQAYKKMFEYIGL